ncbi:MAG: YraN family protein [Burkholderiaceae bacterium]
MTSEELQLYELARAAQKKAVQKRRRRITLPEQQRPIRRAARMSPTQCLGHQSEDQARRHLEAAGLIVLGQNLSSKTGEIDLVCRDGGILAFIEVRRRRTRLYGGAAASVNRGKQLRLIKTASYFLPRLTRRYFNGMTPPCRFDVVTIEPGGLAWLKHAFAMR